MHPYMVQSGDTLLRIARRFDINVHALLAANPALSSMTPMVPGILLAIPYGTESIYCIQPGDTIIGLADRFGCTIQALSAANPHLDLKRLVPGQLLNIHGRARKRIIDARAEYGHRELQRDIALLEREYPFIHVRAIGESVLGKPIMAIKLGEGPIKVHMNAAMHANEWITAPLLMTFVEDAASACHKGDKLCELDIRALLKKVTVWFVPIVNPDGVELAQEGLHPGHPNYSELLRWNRGSTRFTKWKANARGVDLNDQFPAFWDQEVERRDVHGPGPRDYPGHAPLSEPEARALADFTRDECFDLAVALHTQGQEIYWNYRGYEPEGAVNIVKLLAQASGYRPVKLKGSDAGYKDWFIYEFRKPGFTVEIGNGVNPLPLDSFYDLYDEVRPLLLTAMEAAGQV
ncbi:M14 family metallopeptidase [Paenibacillus spongiae]|uniref:M14 family metallopeptidase n=1 Tax=Paenibacillus spongiae TaxID=2909671 RepID=A0ABY5S659_9BACL|nr:M14 family metallopeptidase [Paenibacillus spongiae]UVI28218.1 M14 family metallopeptidase [Paenibacillus spongiae]